MPRRFNIRLFVVALPLAAAAAGCSGGSNGSGTRGPTTPVGVLPGAGVTGAPALAPGCTPASAAECPTASGKCASAQGQSTTVKGSGVSCYYGPTPTATPDATVEYIQEVAGNADYYRFRVTFNPAFVDNTYGTNAIGWVKRGHTFTDLVKSDHAEMTLSDAAGAAVLSVAIDYISEDPSRPCGFGTLGIHGGEGKVLSGNGAYVLAAASSLDRNLNGCGYCESPACSGACTVNSPATDPQYTPNRETPGWDYRVQYEIWVATAAFGSAGFGDATISFVHASPSKGASNTVDVKRGKCPPPPGACPPGSAQSIDEFEHPVCLPPTQEQPDAGATDGAATDGRATDAGTGCPAGTHPQRDELGRTTCVRDDGVVP